MALTNTTIDIPFSASQTTSIASSGTATSDAVTFDQTGVALVATFKADNNGTPASGDTVDVFAQFSAGDPDGTGSSEYPDADHDEFLCRLDTNADEPALASVVLPVGFSSAKFRFKNNSAGRAITVSGVVIEKRSS